MTNTEGSVGRFWFGHSYITSGVVLFTLLVLVFFAILLLIASLQLQHGLTEQKDYPASVGQVREDVAFLEDRSETARKNDATLAGIREQHSQYAIAAKHAQAGRANAARALQHSISMLAADYPGLVAASKPLPTFTDNDDLEDRLQAYTDDIQRDATLSKFDPTALSKFFARLSALSNDPIKQFRTADDAFDSARNRADDLTVQEKRLASPPAELGGRFDPAKQYRGVVEDFIAYKHLLGDFAYWFAFLPNTTLVLLLSITMGVFGSLIFVAKNIVLEDETYFVNEVVFRAGLGGAVALALFFFASAGVFAFSQASAANGKIDMSPYLISFLGITAGYLSDRVTAWMREVGEKAFKLDRDTAPKPEPDRWAVGLDRQLTDQNVSAGTLAVAIDASFDDVQEWHDLQKAVPAGYQKAIALYLRADPSRLFTDIQPPAVTPLAKAA